MVDRTVLAVKIAAVRDAVARVREVLPATSGQLAADRTAREVVTLNLFVALQESLSLAAHWLADAGLSVPQSYAETFEHLGAQNVIPAELAQRLAAASGLRNLIAHRYGALDWDRVHQIASEQLDDLLTFCEVLAQAAKAADSPRE